MEADFLNLQQPIMKLRAQANLRQAASQRAQAMPIIIVLSVNLTLSLTPCYRSISSLRHLYLVTKSLNLYREMTPLIELLQGSTEVTAALIKIKL